MADMYQWTKVATFVVSTATLLLAIGGFLWARRDYGRAQDWKRTEFETKALRDFISSNHYRDLTRLIDGDEVRVLARPEQEKLGDRYLILNRETLKAALRMHSKRIEGSLAPQRKFGPKEMALREIISNYFNDLHVIASYMNDDFARPATFDTYFGYYMDLIGGGLGENNYLSPNMRYRFWKFIVEYKYENVIELFRRRGHDLHAKIVEHEARQAREDAEADRSLPAGIAPAEPLATKTDIPIRSGL